MQWCGIPAVLLSVTCCAPPPAGPAANPPVPAPASVETRPPASGIVGSSVGLDAKGQPILLNDPSASPDTPLCGQQAREANAIGAELQGARVAASGVCANFACYDPLTATYIGADSYRHVCR